MIRQLEEDYQLEVIQHNENIFSTKNATTESWETARRQDVEQMRSLVQNTATISLTAFATTFAFLDKITQSETIKNPIFFFMGMLLFVLNSIGSLWFLLISTDNSLKYSLESYKRNIKEINDFIKINNKYLSGEMPKETHKFLKSKLINELKSQPLIKDLKHQSDPWLKIFILLLAIAFLLLILSLFPCPQGNLLFNC